MIRCVYLIALMCVFPLWSSAKIELPLDAASRTRLAVAQVARAQRIQDLYPGELCYLTGTKGFCIDLPREHYALFPKLSHLEKERLFMMFYLSDEQPMAQSEEIAIRVRVRAASTVAQDTEGSISQLADHKENVAYRDLYERYCKKYLVLCSIASHMERVNGLMAELSARFPDLTQNDRWFLRMHLFCLPCGAYKEDGPLEIYAKDPATLIIHGGGSWGGLKSYLEAQITK